MRTSKVEKKRLLEDTLAAYYQPLVADQLNQAILYSLKAGGKRIRPMIFLNLVEAFGIPLSTAHYQVAATVEMIHTASLIHDDLPAMDNDDYRRGQLTNHKVYGEAVAILAGDSLFLDPFGFLSQIDLPAPILLQLIRELSQASGTFGMVAGQTLDMMGEGRSLTLGELQQIHAHKTGTLFTFPFVAAAIVLELSPEIIERFRNIGKLTGLAFQVRDDILDVTASFEEIGKTPNKDQDAHKATYPSLMGLEGARVFLEECLQQALVELEQIEQEEACDLRDLVALIESMRIKNV
ncbi:polyprenyl synthetase family protein [Streptococcus sp. DD13]|uniref:polyprenyl synthetase family protein n=1 Tax=Streptococcus sp. DD13 TaxID=1777881 RepID=UPI0007999ED8|nr:farnesyl diphosphate synthase [Streptococcus sp. DD13]KXT79248.1 putative synthase or transferase [Streptococcus sp. DD13]